VIDSSAGIPENPDYSAKIAREIEAYRNVENVHDLPAIFHHWSHNYLRPKMEDVGLRGINEFFLDYLSAACHRNPRRRARFVSLGAGNCDFEIGLARRLVEEGCSNFVFECVELNSAMLERGRDLAESSGVIGNLRFLETDMHAWATAGEVGYDCVVAHQSLHHFLHLEEIFAAIKNGLGDEGVFVTSDVIGRNGHMRWPEALQVIESIWREMPDRYKYNHLLRRFEEMYENWDCSTEGFEGIRAQDILPLLTRYFSFEVFLAFGNLVDIFIDRAFGHNFDTANPEDLAFIDRIAALDDDLIDRGTIKPAHLLASMRAGPVKATRVYGCRTPEFSVRWP
jgi:SAM-dependent methyltransferase